MSEDIVERLRDDLARMRQDGAPMWADILEDKTKPLVDEIERLRKVEKAFAELYDAADTVNREERGDPMGMLSFCLFKNRELREALNTGGDDD